MNKYYPECKAQQIGLIGGARCNLYGHIVLIHPIDKDFGIMWTPLCQEHSKLFFQMRLQRMKQFAQQIWGEDYDKM